jgi:hypothetical protein
MLMPEKPIDIRLVGDARSYLKPPPVPEHLQEDIRVCQDCGAEAWTGLPVAEHPHYIDCPQLLRGRAESDER